MGDAQFTISSLAAAAGVGVETVRYYQRIGLLAEPPKPPSGYRVYPPVFLTRLRFIQRAKQLGFTLSEIGELLTLDEADCVPTRHMAQRKLALIRAKADDLAAMASALEALLRECDTRTSPRACPIIDTLTKD